MPNPSILFKDSHLIALEASIGYSIGSARVELEIGYESFKTRGIKDRGNKEEDADALYLLAKGLPHYLVSLQDERFGRALAETTASDLVAFAQAVGYSAPRINDQVCACKAEGPKTSSEYKNYCRGDKFAEKHGPVSL